MSEHFGVIILIVAVFMGYTVTVLTFILARVHDITAALKHRNERA